MERDRWVACISVSRRPLAATCMKGDIGPACRLGRRRSGFVVLRQGSCHLPHSARAGVSGWSIASATAISSTRLFRLRVRLWAIRRSEQRLLASPSCRGRRRQGTRVQGSWVHRRRFWTVAIALNTRQGSLLLVVLPDLPSTIWLLLAPWTVLLVPHPPCLAATRPLSQRLCLFLFRSIDRLKSFSLRSVLSAPPRRLWFGRRRCSNVRLRPSSRILQCGIVQLLQYQHQHPAPASHNQPTPPRPPVRPRSHRRRRSVLGRSVLVHAAATYRTAPHLVSVSVSSWQADQVAGTRASACRGEQRRPVASPRSHRIASRASPPTQHLPAQQQQHRSKQKASLSRRARLPEAPSASARVRES